MPSSPDVQILVREVKSALLEIGIPPCEDLGGGHSGGCWVMEATGSDGGAYGGAGGVLVFWSISGSLSADSERRRSAAGVVTLMNATLGGILITLGFLARTVDATGTWLVTDMQRRSPR